MKLLFSIFLGAFLLASPSGFATELNHLQSAKADGYHLVKSEKLERSFHVYVQLPREYNDTDQDYPVIYLLDGGTNFPMLAPYYFLLKFDEPMPEAIIVGISYGANSRAEGNYRGTDYTAPSPERETYGGASAYQDFLSDELLPLIEGKYRADTSRRILFGQSIAGQFVLYSAMTRPDLFWGRIASNPALHRNLEFFLNLEATKPTTQPRVFIAAATRDDDRFKTPRDAWLQRWENETPPWPLEVQDLEGEYHASAAPLSFRAGMRWLFPTEDNDN